jgi:hypothetical protein
MSSKMRAGLIAGGFGAALDVARVLSPHLTGILPDSLVLLLALILAVLEVFCLGIFSGALAAIWLDLEDYGHQFAAGGFAGAIAALVVMASDTLLSFILLQVPQDQPDTVAMQSLFSRASLAGQVITVVTILIIVVVVLLAALIYMIITLLISGMTTRIGAAGKGVEALQAMIAAQEAQARQGAGMPPPPTDEVGAFDPALLPYRRPEYSPFVNNPPPQVISPWQRRRLEREGKLPPEDASSGESAAPQPGQRGPVYRVYPPPKWRGPTPR